jgi:hypothetical protein
MQNFRTNLPDYPPKGLKLGLHSITAREAPYRDSKGPDGLYILVGFIEVPHEDEGIIAPAVHRLEKMEQLTLFSSST